MSGICLVATLALVGTSSRPSVRFPEDPGLEVSIEPTRALPFEPVHVVIRWTNTGNAAVQRWIPAGPFGHSSQMTVRDADGNKLEFRGVSHPPDTVSAWVLPDESMESAICLTDYLPAFEPGDYTVECQLGLLEMGYVPDVRTGKLEPVAASPPRVTATLRFSVNEPSDPRDIEALRILRSFPDATKETASYPVYKRAAAVLETGSPRYRDAALLATIQRWPEGLGGTPREWKEAYKSGTDAVAGMRDRHLRRRAYARIATLLHGQLRGYADPAPFVMLAMDEVYRPTDAYITGAARQKAKDEAEQRGE